MPHARRVLIDLAASHEPPQPRGRSLPWSKAGEPRPNDTASGFSRPSPPPARKAQHGRPSTEGEAITVAEIAWRARVKRTLFSRHCDLLDHIRARAAQPHTPIPGR